MLLCFALPGVAILVCDCLCFLFLPEVCCFVFCCRSALVLYCTVSQTRRSLPLPWILFGVNEVSECASCLNVIALSENVFTVWCPSFFLSFFSLFVFFCLFSLSCFCLVAASLRI